MQSVLAAESAILFHFKSVGIVLFVFLGIVVSLLALGASECDLISHFGTSVLDSERMSASPLVFASLVYAGQNAVFWRKTPRKKSPHQRGMSIISHKTRLCQGFFILSLLQILGNEKDQACSKHLKLL